MKITMPLKQLRDAVEKSSLAALTKDAQDDERKKSKPTDSCVKITATKDLVVFESSSPKLSALYSMPTDESIIVDQGGVCCIEASVYLKLLNILSKNYIIEITQEDNKDYAKDSSGIIQSNGILTTRVIKNGKEKRRVHNDTFPIDGFTQVDYKHSKVLFSIRAKTLMECVGQVLFATDPKDLSDMLDNVAIVVLDNKIHFAGTDGKRCAIYSPDEMDCVIEKNSQEILINGLLLKKSYEPFDVDEIIDVIDCEDQEHVIFSSGNAKVRLRIASTEVKQKFPNIAANILQHAYPTSIVVDKADLLEAIVFLSHYSTERLIIYANKGESDIKIEEVNKKKAPDDLSNALVKCNQPIMSSLLNPICLELRHIQEGGKKISGKEIKISFSKDEKKIKMESTKDTRFIYMFQTVINSKPTMANPSSSNTGLPF